MDCLKEKDLILASQSPRRRQLLEEIGLSFRIVPVDVEEVFPAGLSAIDTAMFLSKLKANAFPENQLHDNSILLTADTVVSVSDVLLGKPANEAEAISMLEQLSGNCHEVITACTLRSKRNSKSFYAETKVYFKELLPQEIRYYVTHYKPFDKAGAYGIQEWIGKVGIEKITGSYFNVVGLPVHQVYAELCTFDFK